MKPQLPIYPARLSEGQVENISEELDPSLFSSDEIQFSKPVLVKGEAYLAGEHLIVHLHLEGAALVPCRICGEGTEVAIEVPDFYSAEEEFKGGAFDCFPLIRESLLLELPSFIECHGGHCPHREEMVKYLGHDSTHGYHPFKDL